MTLDLDRAAPGHAQSTPPPHEFPPQVPASKIAKAAVARRRRVEILALYLHSALSGTCRDRPGPADQAGRLAGEVARLFEPRSRSRPSPDAASICGWPTGSPPSIAPTAGPPRTSDLPAQGPRARTPMPFAVAGGQAVRQKADPDHRPHGRGRGQARRTGCSTRSSSSRRTAISTGAARATTSRAWSAPARRCSSCAPKGSSPTATSSSTTPATRRPRARARGWARPSWRQLPDAEYALNADAGGGAFRRDGSPLGFGIQTAEKIYQDFNLTATNPRRPLEPAAPGQCDLRTAPSAEPARGHRFKPALTETSGPISPPAPRRKEHPALGSAMRAWVANPNDGTGRRRDRGQRARSRH